MIVIPGYEEEQRSGLWADYWPYIVGGSAATVAIILIVAKKRRDSAAAEKKKKEGGIHWAWNFLIPGITLL